MKKILFTTLLCLITQAHAANFFVGPMVYLKTLTAPNSSFRGVSPNLFFGYGDVYENFYFAGEVFAAPVLGTLTNNSNNGTSVKTTYEFGVDATPGILLNDMTIGYLILGIIDSKFNAPNTMSSGGQVGFGTQVCLSPYWDMRIEYRYTFYHSMTGLNGPKADEFGLGLMYKF